MSALLKISDLWGGYIEGVDILRGISIEVQQGEAVGILGLNGSGKSTFGKAIMNMIPFRRGEILFEGEDITAFSTSQLAHRGISFMQQGGKVFPNLSVWDNLQLASQAKKGQWSEVNDRLTELIPLLRRPKRILQRLMADKLSGGQKHQLSLAMTLTINLSLVILDEPSAGLSPKSVEEMYSMINYLRDSLGVTIILIEQNIAKAVEFCNRTVLLRQGQMSEEFTANSLSEVENIMFK